ncbi:ArsR family transcriptional regulator [Paenibacillus taihuensis]|uniref:ArsR family transcriptional regulator n=1 Tax=Paenibacillus taihuensis TaxID=1156355 RepID=A0A3D9RWW8_9BACL|nr:metalloregulator ArsR/SmtB family transcription factor [Paenibacillus taihuensis]REE81576.1 ArsR family transcriptional regulator [Paenibacillus taihuensis]
MESIEEISESLKLLSDKTRLTILALLKHKDMCVCDIVEILKTTQPNVSQHLKKLKTGGIINETRRSQWIYYSLNVEDKLILKQIIDQLPSMQEQINNSNTTVCT